MQKHQQKLLPIVQILYSLFYFYFFYTCSFVHV